MLSSKLNSIKDAILTIDKMDSGIANATLVDGKNIVVDVEGQEYAGITDTEGNYFYLMPSKETNYNSLQRHCRGRYEVTTNVTGVFVLSNMVVDILVPKIVAIMVNSGALINSTNTDSAKVFKEQTGNEEPTIDFRKWVIFAIDFQIKEVVSSIDKCITDEICKC